MLLSIFGAFRKLSFKDCVNKCNIIHFHHSVIFLIHNQRLFECSALKCCLFSTRIKSSNNFSLFVSDKISKNDFYNKSQEFRAWLLEYVSE